MLFEVPYARFRVVEDGCRQGRICPAGGEDVDEVIEGAGAARRDDGNRQGARYRGGHRAVEAAFRSVTIDRGEQNLAGATRLGFSRPLYRIAVRGCLAAARVHREDVTALLGVYRDDDRLAAVAPRERGNQRRIGQRRRVHADLVRSGLDRRRGVRLGVNAATDGERNEELP